MKGEEVIQHTANLSKLATDKELPKLSEAAHIKLMEIHARALACHCECLGMNAENSLAIYLGKTVPHSEDCYLITMQKWKLIDKEGKPTI